MPSDKVNVIEYNPEIHGKSFLLYPLFVVYHVSVCSHDMNRASEQLSLEFKQ